MPIYRLYHYRDGRIAAFDEFESADDAEAMGAAARRLGIEGGQLWRSGRKLKTIHAAISLVPQ